MSQYDDALTAAERKYGLPSGLLHGLMMTESGGNPKAVSRKGALGLMQFMPATAKQFGIDPLDPMQAIDGAARYMAQNLKATGGDVPAALRLYQGGPDVSKHGPENAAYARKVMGAMPGDSGDLTAMGFNAPTKDDDLGGTGFAPPPIDAVKKARGEVAAFVPASQEVTQGVNAVIKAGVKANKSNAQIKSDVADFYANHGMERQPGGNIDAAIAYHRKGGDGAIPVVSAGSYKPLSNTQTVLGGLKQGVEDIDSTFTGLGAKIGIPGANTLTQKFGADRELFNTTLGNSTLANAGRLAGNIAVSAVPIGAANSLIARGAGALAEAAPGAAGTVSFLGGNAGRAVLDTAGNVVERGNALTRIASTAAHGALQGAEGATVASGGNDAPLLQQIATGAAAGSILGPGGHLLGAGARAGANALAPTVDPIVANLAQRAANYGINIRGSQISGSPFIRTLDSVLTHSPGSGIAADNAVQRSAFTRAVGNTFGADTDRLTPEVMTRARDQIGNTMNTIANRTRIQVDDQFINDLANIEDEAHQVVTGQEFQPLRNQLNNVLQKVQGAGDGGIDGEVYQALTRKGAPLDRAMDSADPNVSHYATRIRDALDDAMERSASPEDVQALQAARFAYKNMKTVEPLVSKSADGTISPASLNQRVSVKFANRAYDGGGPLGELADIGQRFLKEGPDSGTAQRSRAFNVLANIAKYGAAAGAGVLGVKAGVSLPEVGLAALAGGTALGGGRLAGEALSSNWYRNSLLRATLDNDPTGGYVPAWLTTNLVPLTVAGSNRLIQGSTQPSGSGS